MTRIDHLAQAAFALYRRACTAAGIDPDLDLTIATIGHGVDARVWAAHQLTAAATRTGLAYCDGPVTDREVDRRLIGVRRTRRAEAAVMLLAAAGHVSTLVGLAGTSRDSELLAELATHRREFVRLNVANNPSTPAGTLRDLRWDPEASVRQSARGALERLS